MTMLCHGAAADGSSHQATFAVESQSSLPMRDMHQNEKKLRAMHASGITDGEVATQV